MIEHRSPVGRELEKLLKIPIDSYNDVLIVLNLEHFIPLLTFFDYRNVYVIYELNLIKKVMQVSVIFMNFSLGDLLIT